MLVKVFYDTSFKMKVTRDVSIHNTLNRAADFSEQPQFTSTKTYLLALNVTNFDAKFTYQEMVDVGGCGCR